MRGVLQSDYAFETGISLYREYKYDEALQILGDVVESSENYETAMQIIDDHYKHEEVFAEAALNNTMGRNPLPNAIAQKDDFMYIPYINDGAYCIVKIKKDSYLTYVFPIIGTEYPSDIDNINIIGDYIYFTLNSKFTVEKDYSGIYKIKTDGSALQKLSDDILTEFISYGDKFYGVTTDGELRRYDSRFIDYDVIYEGDIRSMQLKDDGIYLGIVQSDENKTLILNILSGISRR